MKFETSTAPSEQQSEREVTPEQVMAESFLAAATPDAGELFTKMQKGRDLVSREQLIDLIHEFNRMAKERTQLRRDTAAPPVPIESVVIRISGFDIVMERARSGRYFSMFSPRLGVNPLD